MSGNRSSQQSSSQRCRQDHARDHPGLRTPPMVYRSLNPRSRSTVGHPVQRAVNIPVLRGRARRPTAPAPFDEQLYVCCIFTHSPSVVVGRHGSRMFAEDRFCGATSTPRTSYQHFGGLIYGKGWDLLLGPLWSELRSIADIHGVLFRFSCARHFPPVSTSIVRPKCAIWLMRCCLA